MRDIVRLLNDNVYFVVPGRIYTSFMPGLCDIFDFNGVFDAF